VSSSVCFANRTSHFGRMATLDSIDCIRHALGFSRLRRSAFAVLGAACAAAVSYTPAVAWPYYFDYPPAYFDYPPAVAARPLVRPRAKGSVKRDAQPVVKRRNFKSDDVVHVSKAPFGDIPSGPFQIIISIDQQKLHLYSDGALVTNTLVATGVPAHPTPMGVFSVIGKERYHESNIYSGAPMPFMQRITWSGVALHQGAKLGHRASHGCIRMSEDFASRLWVLRSLGARVLIAGPELKPVEVADPHLFVHRDWPVAPPTIVTAETVDGKTSDAVAAEPGAEASARDSDARHAADAAGESTTEDDAVHAKITDAAASVDSAEVDPDVVPMPRPKPTDLVRGTIGEPIAIFVSRKTSRLYVRQHFAPLFDVPITIDHPDEPLGTHVFTALEYLADGSTFRWNVVSMLPERVKDENKSKSAAKAKQRDAATPPYPPAPDLHDVLARLEIPGGAIDRISGLMVAGSSLIVSDQGLGDETGEGTDFIVITHAYDRDATGNEPGVMRHIIRHPTVIRTYVRDAAAEEQRTMQFGLAPEQRVHVKRVYVRPLSWPQPDPYSR
jgi:lipoprotein-anchoring transpeptidase ErfK/SrfK